jgi:CheY-like chemotaxis protein
VTTGSLDKFPPVVLIVEDDSLLRMFAVEVVAEAGFVPVEAGDADEAVTLLEARPDISLQFTDINMPGSMGGVRRPLSSFAQTCCK